MDHLFVFRSSSCINGGNASNSSIYGSGDAYQCPKIILARIISDDCSAPLSWENMMSRLVRWKYNLIIISRNARTPAQSQRLNFTKPAASSPLPLSTEDSCIPCSENNVLPATFITAHGVRPEPHSPSGVTLQIYQLHPPPAPENPPSTQHIPPTLTKPPPRTTSPLSQTFTMPIPAKKANEAHASNPSISGPFTAPRTVSAQHLPICVTQNLSNRGRMHAQHKCGKT